MNEAEATSIGLADAERPGVRSCCGISLKNLRSTVSIVCASLPLRTFCWAKQQNQNGELSVVAAASDSGAASKAPNRLKQQIMRH